MQSPWTLKKQREVNAKKTPMYLTFKLKHQNELRIFLGQINR